MTEQSSKKKTNRKVLAGVVVSTKMKNTATVKVETKTRHPLYKKMVIRHKKYHADNRGENVAQLGDFVQITETRPLSATKCWWVSKIIEKVK